MFLLYVFFLTASNFRKKGAHHPWDEVLPHFACGRTQRWWGVSERRQGANRSAQASARARAPGKNFFAIGTKMYNMAAVNILVTNEHASFELCRNLGGREDAWPRDDNPALVRVRDFACAPQCRIDDACEYKHAHAADAGQECVTAPRFRARDVLVNPRVAQR